MTTWLQDEELEAHAEQFRASLKESRRLGKGLVYVAGPHGKTCSMAAVEGNGDELKLAEQGLTALGALARMY